MAKAKRVRTMGRPKPPSFPLTSCVCILLDLIWELSVILTHGNLPPNEGQKTAQTSSKKGELWCPQGSRRPLRSIIVRNAEYSHLI
jgi:hypothetical protein